MPDVAIVAPEHVVKQHPSYPAAKTGNVDAAVDLVIDVMNVKADRKLRRLIGRDQPIVVPVHAVEGKSTNVIPRVYADFFVEKYDLRVDESILQINRVSHTSSSGYHRLATPAIFAGDVLGEANYLIVDDFIGQGGTVASIKGYIESEGGIVTGVSTLTGQRRSATITLSNDTLVKLRDKHEDLEQWWYQVFGYGFEFLTESEARYLIRSQDADTIRDRLAQAARAASESLR